jgi:hypothetical protein
MEASINGVCLFVVLNLVAPVAHGKDKDADFDSSKCRDISNDCCVAHELGESAACAGGWKVTWEDESKSSPFQSECCRMAEDHVTCLAKTYTCKHPVPDWAIPLIAIAALVFLVASGMASVYVLNRQCYNDCIAMAKKECFCCFFKKAGQSTPRQVQMIANNGEYPAPPFAQPVATSAAVHTQPQLSVADELQKLKALLDNKALTQAEFDAQKQKLLQ